MEEALWEFWYSSSSTSYALIGMIASIGGVLALLGLILSVFFGKEGATKIVGFLAICAIVALLQIFSTKPAETHYRNALNFRYGNDGFHINEDMALAAFRRAADGEHMLACRALGDMLEARGDTLEAINYWIEAIKLGDAKSARQLGDLYAKSNFQNLSEGERLNSAYIAYFEGLCLGDDTLRKEVDQLRPQVSWQTHKDAVDKCAALKKHKRTKEKSYTQYLPAPHEMAADAAALRGGTKTPEKSISVQEVRPIVPDVLQTLMKTRGYAFLGRHTILSEYSPSLSNIRKAAHEIGASNVLYTEVNRETVKEKKRDFSQLVSALVKQDYGSALQESVKNRRYVDDVTYRTYTISYWTKMKDDNAAKLSQKEVLLLKGELKKARQDARRMKQEISCLEEKAAPAQRALAQQASTGAEVAMDDSTRRSLMELEELWEKRRDLERQSYQIAAMETSIQNDEARKKGEPVDRGYGDNDFALKNLW